MKCNTCKKPISKYFYEDWLGKLNCKKCSEKETEKEQQELLKKKYEVITNEYLEPNYLRFLPNLKRIFNGETNIEYEFIKPFGYYLTGLLYIWNMGNINKIRDFHHNENPIFQRLKNIKIGRAHV